MYLWVDQECMCVWVIFSLNFGEEKKPKAKKGEEKHLGGESGDIQGRGGQRKPLTLVTKDRDKDILWAGKSLLYVSWWGMYMKLNV